MGLYDDDAPNLGSDSANVDEIGKAVAQANRKKSSRGFEMPSFSMGDSVKKVLIILLAVLIVGAIGYALYNGMSKNMDVRIDPAKIYLGDNSTAKLTLKVKNNEDYTMKNISISVMPQDNLSIAIIPSGRMEIPILGIGESRTISYDVGLIGQPLAGEYSIKVKVVTSQKTYEQDVIWTVLESK